MKPAVSPTSTAPSPPVRSIVLGTAGHIDHGKTALVFALTGTDTDRLPEEKSRGITIDLGFASLTLEDDQGHRVDLSLIDVPGHHAFIRNMLAGAGGIDCVMLVIAADEGVMAQTQEHLAICTLLGIRYGVIALTKSDAVSSERLAEARAEVTRFVEHTFLEHAPVVAVSALNREGLGELKVALGRVLSRIPERSTQFVTRLPLDRAFTVRGFGTVVTGTLQSGSIRAEEALELQPGARAVRVRGVQVHGQSRREAAAPNRVALNLAGVEVAEIKRGDTIVPPHTLVPVSTVDAEITMVPGAPPPRHRARVRVHAFTADALATVLVYDTQPAAQSGSTLVRLRLSKPLVLAPGDRFVLRQPSPETTIGGGRVLDAHPLPRLRKAAAQRWLQQVRNADLSEQVRLRVTRRGTAGVRAEDLVRETGLTLAAGREILRGLVSGRKLIISGEIGASTAGVLAPEAFTQAQELALRELGRTRDGSVPHAELRSRTRLEEWVFELVLRSLLEQGLAEPTRDGLRLPGRPAAAAADGRIAAVERIYAAAGLASPILSEVAGKLGIAPKEMHPIITALLRNGKLVRMGADNLLIHRDALERLVFELRKHRAEAFDVGRFKTFTGLTRKHAIPLLEYLDGARVTRNDKGTRVVL